jgi:hypothetical protein
MFGSVSNSFELVKASAKVLRLDGELMVFPLLSGVATMLVAASFVAPLFVSDGWRIFAEGEQASYLAYVLGFLFYLSQYTVIFFFNSALVGAALIRLDGGDPTVSDGLAIASKRMGAIIGYAALAATVGMVLRFVSERSGFVGKIVVGLIGMAWTLATYMAVPVLVTKNLGPIDAVKESAALFKRTWGEQVVGNAGMSWAIGFMGFSWAIVSFALVFGAAGTFPSLMIPAIGVSVLGFLFLGLLGSALKGIYTAALYRYAMTGEAGNFDPHVIGAAFRRK